MRILGFFAAVTSASLFSARGLTRACMRHARGNDAFDAAELTPQCKSMGSATLHGHEYGLNVD